MTHGMTHSEPIELRLGNDSEPIEHLPMNICQTAALLHVALLCSVLLCLCRSNCFPTKYKRSAKCVV